MVDQELLDVIFAQVNSLPPLPQIAHRTLALLRDPNSNIHEIANLIALDQVISRNVLGWANSAYYALPHGVNTLSQAIIYLGQTTVRSIVLTACVSGVLNRALPGYGLDRGDLWLHSISVAIGARQVAARISKAAGEEAYFAGLMCDVGKLGFEIGLRDMDLSTPEWQKKPFDEIETEIFGINHAGMGNIIARKWQLPEGICQTILYHHQPSLAVSNERLVTAAVHIADLAATMVGVGIGGDGLRYQADAEAFDALNFKEHDLPILINEITSNVNRIADDFGLKKL